MNITMAKVIVVIMINFQFLNLKRTLLNKASFFCRTNVYIFRPFLFLYRIFHVSFNIKTKLVGFIDFFPIFTPDLKFNPKLI